MTDELYRWDIPKRREPEVVAAWRAGSMGQRQQLRLIRDVFGRWLVRHEVRGGQDHAVTFGDRDDADAEIAAIKIASRLEWEPISTRSRVRQ